MPERLDIRRGDTLPTLKFQVRLPSGQTMPSVDGATAVLFARASGSTTAAVQWPGEVTLELQNNVITGTYAPTGAETTEVAEYEAECEIRFADGQVLTAPRPKNGQSRYFTISVTDDLGDAQLFPVDDSTGLDFGLWFGEWFGS